MNRYELNQKQLDRIEELENANREAVEGLIFAYKSNDHWGESNYHRWLKADEAIVKKIIEKNTGKPISEVLK